jgi:hypothetical protein
MTSVRIAVGAAGLAALAALGPAVTASAATIGPARTGTTAPAAAAVSTAYSVEEAGYQASGTSWRYRYAQATVKLPSPVTSPYAGGEGVSVQLRAADQTVVLGISATPQSAFWNSGVAVEQQDGQGTCSTPGGCFSHVNGNSPLFAAGDSVTFDLYYNRSAGTIYYTATDTTLGQAFAGFFPDGGELFTSARTGVEFGQDPWSAGTGYTAPVTPRALATFTAIRFTSYNGTKGYLGGAKWTTTRVSTTATGMAAGALIAAPSAPAGSGATSFTVTAAT